MALKQIVSFSVEAPGIPLLRITRCVSRSHHLPSLSTGLGQNDGGGGRDSVEFQSRRDQRDNDSDSSSSSGHHGDGDEDNSDGDSSSSSSSDDGVALKNTAKEPDRRVPPASVSSLWEKTLRFPRPGSSFTSKPSTFSKSAKSLTDRWADPVSAPAFAAPRKDDCLAGFFEKVRSSDKSLHDFAFEAMRNAGGAAHAAMAAATYMDDEIPKLALRLVSALIPEDKPQHKEWLQWVKGEMSRVHVEATKCITDSVKINASLYGKGFWLMRDAVMKKCDKSVQPTLRNRAPEDNSFFGNPTDAIQSSVGLAFMTDQMSKPASRGSKRSSTFSAPFPKRHASASTSASTAAGRSSSGNGRGRLNRGGSSARGKK